MATVGNTATPSATFGFYSVNASNMLAIKLTMPGSGLITAVSCYMAGHGATVHPVMMIWDASGNILGQSAALTVAAGTGGVGGQGFHAGTLITPVFLTAGTQFYCGFWRPPAETDEWTENNGGTEYQKTSAATSPVALTSPSAVSGTPSFFATYTPAAGVKVRRAGVWTAGTIKVRRAGAWVTPPIYVRRSGAWVRIQ